MSKNILKKFNSINNNYIEYLDEEANHAIDFFNQYRSEFFSKYPGLEKIYYIVDNELRYGEPSIHVYLNDEKMKLHDFYDPEYNDHILNIFDQKYYSEIDCYINGDELKLSSEKLNENIEDLKNTLIEYYDEICKEFDNLIAVLPFNILYNMYLGCNCFSKE